MLKVLLATVFLAQGVFAQQVEVRIDGERYYCSQDPNNIDDGDAACVKAARRFLQEFEACKGTTSNHSYCFDKSYGKVDSSVKKCGDVAAACNDACKGTTSNHSYCYDKCY